MMRFWQIDVLWNTRSRIEFDESHIKKCIDYEFGELTSLYPDWTEVERHEAAHRNVAIGLLRASNHREYQNMARKIK
jgi:hypothetical protein